MLHGFLFTAFSLGLHLAVIIIASIVRVLKHFFRRLKAVKPPELPEPVLALNPAPAITEDSFLQNKLTAAPNRAPENKSQTFVIACAKTNCNHMRDPDCEINITVRQFAQ